MHTLHFDSDYMRGAHPEVLKALVETNAEQTVGYGLDPYSVGAKRLIREQCAAPSASVWLLVGGTQTNATVIDAVVGRYQGVIAADTAHINVHEAGAVEAAGHKVIVLSGTDGKLRAEQVQEYLQAFYADETHDHMSGPGMIYISFPTEIGTIYTREELKALHDVAREYHIRLYIDGARLAYGLAASPDLTLAEIAEYADVFYIGGTKEGCLLGEAVVAKEGVLPSYMFSLIKAHGALLAKGRILGVQFEALMRGNLLQRIGENGVQTARLLRDVFVNRGFYPFIDSPTNQQFFRLPNTLIDALMEHATFEYWGPRGTTESEVRFVTDWGTRPEDIQLLATLVDEALK